MCIRTAPCNHKLERIPKATLVVARAQAALHTCCSTARTTLTPGQCQSGNWQVHSGVTLPLPWRWSIVGLSCGSKGRWNEEPRQGLGG